jgi:NAD(P)-dependent dehydrogenase (short-subunit alcohol dehydrogenase family)
VKTILITGAASGIGAATARKFAAEGWRTLLTDIDGPGLEHLSGEIGAEQAPWFSFDVRDLDGLARAMDFAAGHTGGTLDVLFSNAGVAAFGSFGDISAGRHADIVDVNLKAVIHGAQAALPLLRKAPAGRIINVGSVSGLVGVPGLAAYSATKWGVRGFTEALDAELRAEGLRVVSLMPWFIDTPLLDKGRPEPGARPAKDEMRAGGVPVYDVSLVAEAAWQAAHGDRLHYTVGQRAAQTGFAARWLPGVVRRRMRRGFLLGTDPD